MFFASIFVKSFHSIHALFFLTSNTLEKTFRQPIKLFEGYFILQIR